MKSSGAADMIEGPEAWARFKDTMKLVMAVPHAEIKKRIEAERERSLKNPNRRGPKPKRGVSPVPAA